MCTIFFLLESEQVTGSFKARGAGNKISKYADTLRNSIGPITSSTGNHGLGCVSYSVATLDVSDIPIDFQLGF